MGMVRSSITVTAAGAAVETTAAADADLSPVPAGVNIPTENVAVAQVNRDIGYQMVTINLKDDGFEPSIIVVQRDIPTNWIINNDSLDKGNSRLIVPAYLSQLDIEVGDNGIQFMPAESFDFSTGDNIYYGYVKVVDDINNINIEGIKKEAGDFETLIYPDAYFDSVSQGGGCCGRRNNG
jgi:hypothetical protein